MFSIMLKIFRVALPIILLILVLWAINSYINESKFIRDSLEANGRIVDFIVARSSSKIGEEPVRCAIVQYTTQDNRSFKFRSRFCSNFKLQRYQLGESVKVLYNPENPQRAIIGDLLNSYSNSIGALVMFIISLIGLLSVKLFKKFKINR